MNTVILSDNRDGHINQSIGIAEILKDSLELSYTIVDVKLRNPFLKGLKYKFIKRLSKKLTKQNIRIILSFFAFWNVLFTKRYPVNWHRFWVENLRWSTRVKLYLSFMSEEYPPFHGKA